MKPYYQDDFCTIYNSDCRSVLATLPEVDLLLSDPPYGIGEAAGKNKSRGRNAFSRDYGNLSWDNERIDPELMKLAVRVAKNSIVFGGNYYADILPASSCWLVWDKDNGASDFADCELAWTNLDMAVRRKIYRWNGYLQEKMGKLKEQRWHPTQKPLEIMQWCITVADKHGERQTIIDPFMGSGTTLVAAKNLGRKAIGIEIEEKYCEIAVKRLRQEVLPLS